MGKLNRLTSDGNFCDIAQCQEVPCKYPDTGCSQKQAWERLKAYERTGLMPDEVEAMKVAMMGKSVAEVKEFCGIPLEKMVEIAEAYRTGRCVVLPCKVGDEILMPTGRFSVTGYEPDVCDGFYIARDGVLQIKARGWTGNHASYGVPGKTVFLTREDAEAAIGGGRHV